MRIVDLLRSTSAADASWELRTALQNVGIVGTDEMSDNELVERGIQYMQMFIWKPAQSKQRKRAAPVSSVSSKPSESSWDVDDAEYTFI